MCVCVFSDCGDNYLVGAVFIVVTPVRSLWLCVALMSHEDTATVRC